MVILITITDFMFDQILIPVSEIIARSWFLSGIFLLVILFSAIQLFFPHKGE